MGIFHSKKIMPRKVAVLGAAGGIGQPLSMLIKSLPEVKELVSEALDFSAGRATTGLPAVDV